MKGTLACWCLFLLLFGLCSRDQPAELYGTAQAEEARNNRLSAEATYERIIREFPDSAQAAQARERLATLRRLRVTQEGK
jgi:hypothetical protein